MIESDSDEATTEVISHTEGLEALEGALLYVEQRSKATPTDVIFMKRWRDIAASSRRSTLYEKKITDFLEKGQFINV
jgi:quinol monooxygenase YgiN